ncbi:MAG TPA: hypothetical protein VJ278_01200, partial [Chthoniobacterales bacterium]|nr:hypothetical protein [Chthoniobacterales bacterium]
NYFRGYDLGTGLSESFSVSTRVTQLDPSRLAVGITCCAVLGFASQARSPFLPTVVSYFGNRKLLSKCKSGVSTIGKNALLPWGTKLGFTEPALHLSLTSYEIGRSGGNLTWSF